MREKLGMGVSEQKKDICMDLHSIYFEQFNLSIQAY